MAVFTVSNLNDSGAGSLRQALVGSNADPGPAVIDFAVAGTITLTSAALPAITHPVVIDGTSAPGFAGRAPVVEVDNNGFGGLLFDAGSAGSALRSLSIVRSGSDGVTLNAGNISIAGAYIGVAPDGTTALGNLGSGLVINATSSGDAIGAPSTVAAGSVLSAASNVISGNIGNGIVVDGSSGNAIMANYIGTTAGGLGRLGNGGAGLLVEAGASGNLIGGTIPFVNDPGAAPQGNLISSNGGAGVVLTGGASSNTLAANFIGTDLTGNAPLGNAGDGVDILAGADGNTLTGTVFGRIPFIYANIVSGNLGNGIVVDDSNNTTIQANFFGLGYNNMTPVGNALDGVLIEGSSAGTQFGGVIPLGNVSAANGGNGVEIRDTASGTTVFNTFAGLAAFQDYTNLGNGRDGMLITSTGGGNLIRTNVVSNNNRNGIELAGEATGVQVTETIVGLNTDGKSAMPNGADGILIGGDAHGNAIGGFQPSVIPENTISANRGHGVAIVGTAHNNLVIHSDIGTAVLGKAALGNFGDGVYLGPGTSQNAIGGTAPGYADVISGNLGNGVELSGTGQNVVSGNLIGTDSRITAPVPNGSNGIYIDGSSGNLIGTGNVVAYNAGAGVFVNSGAGNAILQDSIVANQGGSIVLRPGANGGQGAPLLTHIRRGPGVTGIGGRMYGAPNSTYLLEFFASDPTGPGVPAGGQVYLGTAAVTTDRTGVALVRFYTPTRPATTLFTATATSAAGNTSPFSDAVRGTA